jgi:hypothetical protein
MQRFITGLSLAAVVVLALFAAAGTAYVKDPQAAAHGHDGLYAVHITTRHGSCGQHNWRIAVSGGWVRSAGHTPARASGHVDGNGSVSLTFHRLWYFAKATGKLRAGTGSGTWTLPSMGCSGSWRATRHI